MAVQDSDIAAGAQVRVRGQDWLVTGIQGSGFPGSPRIIDVRGVSELVKGTEASFDDTLDRIEPVDPAATRLVADESAGFIQSRLFIESIARRIPVGSGDATLRTGHATLVDRLAYQQVPVAKALAMLRPRILIGDAVGLGKTVEVAMLLNELAARGAASRVLVAVPQAILEQVQHELWCRTGFPLVRLDTAGIQRMRRQIPAGRNPFSYFKRVIVSIDTIKRDDYTHLLDKSRWDVVWIDECHGVINRSAQRSKVAQMLARRSDGFILTSATPHSGNPESFAELISLLDPTAIADPSDYEAADIAHLFVRRHRHSSEVAAEVSEQWKERHEPEVVPVTPSPAEEAIFTELTDTWLSAGSGAALDTPRLFPWTLFKSALSSPIALRETAMARLDPDRPRKKPISDNEDVALRRLVAITDQAIDEGDTAKFARLTDELAGHGVTVKGKGRAVIFSERVPTLEWLAERFTAAGWTPEQMVVFHAGMDEETRQEKVKEFGLADSKVRLFITGDIASEGVNLHRECHLLFHWDLPWSLIRIQQRNGRIDRYGQTDRPVIKALVTSPADEATKGDANIIARLLTKEHVAHTNIGDAAAIMGEWDGDAEEDAIIEALSAATTTTARDAAVEEITVAPTDDAWSWGNPVEQLATTGNLGGDPETAVRTGPPNRLFPDNVAFLDAVVSTIDGGDQVDWTTEGDIVAFTPPRDLLRRFDDLPAELVRGLGLAKQVKVTASKDKGTAALSDALKRRQADKELNPDGKAASAWPDVGYLTDQHPVTLWASDLAATRFPRATAPVITTPAVTGDVVVCVATWSNTQGEPLASRWYPIDFSDPIPTVIDDAFGWFAQIGLDKPVPNTTTGDLDRLQALVPRAVDYARQRITEGRDDLLADVEIDLADALARLQDWEATVRADAAAQASPAHRNRLTAHADAVHADIQGLVTNLKPADSPSIRVVAVITGA